VAILDSGNETLSRSRFPGKRFLRHVRQPPLFFDNLSDGKRFGSNHELCSALRTDFSVLSLEMLFERRYVFAFMLWGFRRFLDLECSSM